MASEYPMFLYEYNADGRYGPPLEIGNSVALHVAMRTIVQTAIDQGREIIITDTGDFCCFHAKDGQIVFPTKEQLVAGRVG